MGFSPMVPHVKRSMLVSTFHVPTTRRVLITQLQLEMTQVVEDVLATLVIMGTVVFVPILMHVWVFHVDQEPSVQIYLLLL
jgi:hypothetical protein